MHAGNMGIKTCCSLNIHILSVSMWWWVHRLYIHTETKTKPDIDNATNTLQSSCVATVLINEQSRGTKSVNKNYNMQANESDTLASNGKTECRTAFSRWSIECWGFWPTKHPKTMLQFLKWLKQHAEMAAGTGLSFPLPVHADTDPMFSYQNILNDWHWRGFLSSKT